MKKSFLLSMIFIFALSLVMVIGALADEPVTNAARGDDVSIDTLKFVDPWQYTSKDVSSFAPPPVRGFKAGTTPLWMNLFINIDNAKMVTAYYLLINPQTGKRKIYKADFNLSQGGNWRISLGWPNGAPSDLVGIQVLVGVVMSGSEKDVCTKYWPFKVVP